MQQGGLNVRHEVSRTPPLDTHAGLTLSLCSLRLMMTAVICWSIKMRMVQSRAGSAAMGNVHQGLLPSGSISHPRVLDVGCSNDIIDMNMVQFLFIFYHHAAE